MEESEKYRVSDIRIALLDLKAGHHASASSTTNIFRSAFKYDEIVSSSGPLVSPFAMSLRMFGMEDCVPCSRQARSVI